MSQAPNPLPKITLHGSPFEVGRQFGEQARPRILRHLANQKAAFARLRPKNPLWWRNEIGRFLPTYETFAPHMVAEMQGCAQGADVTPEEIYLLNIRDEILSSLRPEATEGCTSFGCSGDLTLGQTPILGQTKDTAAISQDLYVVTATYQRGRPNLLQMPYAGEFGVFGLSSSGMAILGNALYVRGRPAGTLPLSLFRRLVLESETVDEVIALVGKHGVATAGSLTIGDASGRVVAIEISDHGHGVVEARDGILTHANHIIAPHLAKYEAYEEPERGWSYHRQARLADLLNAERGRLTAPLAMRCLMDHAGYPHSVCRHPQLGADSDAAGDLQTTASIVVEPKLGKLHAIRGFPCQGWTATYSFSGSES